MANTRGIFGLLDVRSRIRKNTWVPPEEVYLNDPIPNAGYFGGGQGTPGGVYSTMDKTTYSSDTTAAVPGTNLTIARGDLAATGNSTAGYFGGGNNPGGPMGTVDKVSYASDTTATVPGAAIATRYRHAATGNSVSGYFGGGGIPLKSSVDKVTYLTDTAVTVPSANLTLARNFIVATGNSFSGYFSGGNAPGAGYTLVDKLTYSTDTTSAVPAISMGSVYGRGATGNSTAGYFGGGRDGSPLSSKTDKVTYSTDTSSTIPGAALSAARGYLAATGNSTAGYFGGGNAFAPTYYSTTDKITFSNDTRVATIPGLNLSVARSNLAASSLRANGLPSTPIANTVRGSNFVSKGTSFNTGYFGGGLLIAPTPSSHSTMDKVIYSTDTTVRIPGANLSVARERLAATGNSTAGYFGGAYGYSTMDKVTYSTDTTAALPTAGFLTVARGLLAATGNSTAGYFGGGQVGPGPVYSTVDKVTYASDTTTAVPGASLSAARYSLAATGNSIAGYFGAGNSIPAPRYSTMDKLTYSTDTTVVVPSAALSSTRYRHSATGNSTAGYFGGGNFAGSVRSWIDKLTYSTDTTALLATKLSISRQGQGATGNSTSGYFGGGYGAAEHSTMDKLDYSTEVATRTPGASLSAARAYLAASSSTANALSQQDITATPQAIQGNTGYFGGGSTPANTSIVDKVTYSTDTTALVPGASLSAPRQQSAATGSSTAGYFGGGSGPGGAVSTMDKVTYAADTTAAVPGAALSAVCSRAAATGNSIAGYFGGGASPQRSTMDKVTYSTDTTVAVPGSALSSARYASAASGNSIAGYFGGGITPGASPAFRSIMDKVTYSTDTRSTVPGANLTVARFNLAATGNSTSGYFGGGFITGSPTNALYSTVDKVTYSTDTTSVVPGASLSATRYSLGATGNSTVGYFGGGYSSPNFYSTMDKVTYSTDTTARVAAAALSAARSYAFASSSVANAVRGTVPQVPIV